MLLLVIDVGNTNTVIGVYKENRLLHHFRISTARATTADESGILLLSLLERHNFSAKDVQGIILASVVPQVNRSWKGAASIYFKKEAHVVGAGVKTGMQILTDQPQEVGADRIVNAIAAWSDYQQALIVVDFGTATTFDVVNEKGAYIGGAISPGIIISMDALFDRTSKLPRIEISKPPQIIGKNTISALQSGLYYGYAGLVDSIIERMQEEIGKKVMVIATGGLAPLIAESSKHIQKVDEFLTLKGLRLIYERNIK